jgi:thiol-disulfide isomerase/thioredoxin
MAQRIVKMIFGDRKLPEGLSDTEMDKYFSSNFPQWITEFEEGGFLDSTKVPSIVGEDDLLTKLRDTKDGMFIIKYWKRGCIPCLATSEMYKEAEGRAKSEGKNISFYSVNIKDEACKEMVENQLVEGTPTFQAFCNNKQMGDEIKEMNMAAFWGKLEERFAQCKEERASISR